MSEGGLEPGNPRVFPGSALEYAGGGEIPGSGISCAHASGHASARVKHNPLSRPRAATPGVTAARLAKSAGVLPVSHDSRHAGPWPPSARLTSRTVAAGPESARDIRRSGLQSVWHEIRRCRARMIVRRSRRPLCAWARPAEGLLIAAPGYQSRLSRSGGGVARCAHKLLQVLRIQARPLRYEVLALSSAGSPMNEHVAVAWTITGIVSLLCGSLTPTFRWLLSRLSEKAAWSSLLAPGPLWGHRLPCPTFAR